MGRIKWFITVKRLKISITRHFKKPKLKLCINLALKYWYCQGPETDNIVRKINDKLKLRWWQQIDHKYIHTYVYVWKQKKINCTKNDLIWHGPRNGHNDKNLLTQIHCKADDGKSQRRKKTVEIWNTCLPQRIWYGRVQVKDIFLHVTLTFA